MGVTVEDPTQSSNAVVEIPCVRTTVEVIAYIPLHGRPDPQKALGHWQKHPIGLLIWEDTALSAARLEIGSLLAVAKGKDRLERLHGHER